MSLNNKKNKKKSIDTVSQIIVEVIKVSIVSRLFSEGIILQVNEITRLGIELAYSKATVLHVTRNVTGTPLVLR